MVFLLPPHDEALRPLLQSLYEDGLGDLQCRGVRLPQLNVDPGQCLVTTQCAVWSSRSHLGNTSQVTGLLR